MTMISAVNTILPLEVLSEIVPLPGATTTRSSAAAFNDFLFLFNGRNWFKR